MHRFRSVASCAKTHPYHVNVWTGFCSELCCSLSAAQRCKVFQHKYFGFTLPAVTLPEDFADLNPIVCFFFKLTCILWWCTRKKWFSTFSSGTFAHVKESFKKEKKISCTSVEKRTLKQYSINTNGNIINKMHFACIFQSAPHLAAAALPNWEVCLRNRRHTELQWLSSFCLQKNSARWQKLRDAANDSPCVRLLRVSTTFAANPHTFTITVDVNSVVAESLTYQCTEVMSVHNDFRWNLCFLAIN